MTKSYSCSPLKASKTLDKQVKFHSTTTGNVKVKGIDRKGDGSKKK